MIEVKGIYPPAIMVVGDKKYVIGTRSGWVQVPMETTLKDVKWIDTYVKPINETFEVEGSGGRKYIVKKNKDGVTCTCPGFKFRRKCKHTGMV